MKNGSSDVRGDRIPILSKVSVIRESLTESELCPPGPCVKDLIKKKQWSTSFYKQTVCNRCLGGQNSDSVISRGLSDHSLTESELYPPGP